MNQFKKVLKTEMQCIQHPCCERSNTTDFRDWVERVYQGDHNPRSFDIVYHDETLGNMVTMPIVGDHVFGYTVWRVDYDEQVVYVTK